MTTLTEPNPPRRTFLGHVTGAAAMVGILHSGTRRAQADDSEARLATLRADHQRTVKREAFLYATTAHDAPELDDLHDRRIDLFEDAADIRAATMVGIRTKIEMLQNDLAFLGADRPEADYHFTIMASVIDDVMALGRT
jgi:hypothetical protein